MPRVEVIEVQGVVQTGGKPGPASVTLDTLGADTLAMISGGSGATTIADGADVAQGARADAAWSGSGVTTVIGALKAIFGKANTTDSTQGTISDAAWSGTGDGSEVAIAKSIRGLLSTLAGAVSASRMNATILRAPTSTSVAIASGAQESAVIDISTWIAGGFVIPAAFTGSSVTFKVSHTQSSQVDLYDQYGNLVTTPITVNRAFPFPQEAAGFASIVIRSSAAEGAARTIALHKKG